MSAQMHAKIPRAPPTPKIDVDQRLEQLQAALDLIAGRQAAFSGRRSTWTMGGQGDAGQAVDQRPGCDAGVVPPTLFFAGKIR